MWKNVTATKDNLNQCIIANTRYHPTNIAIVYGYGADGTVYYPLSGWIDTNGDLLIVPQHNLELKYITIKFDYYTQTFVLILNISRTVINCHCITCCARKC